MKKPILCAAAAISIGAALIGAGLLLSPLHSASYMPSEIAASFDTASDIAQNAPQGTMRPYSNGAATFTYGDTLCFEEMLSDNAEGYPLTSFLPVDSTSALPRVDILTTEPVSRDITAEQWTDTARGMILGYYHESERERVSVSFSEPVIKPDENGVKLFITFNTALNGSATPDMHGVLRLISDNEKGVATLALCGKGETLPQAMEMLYMSTELN